MGFVGELCFAGGTDWQNVGRTKSKDPEVEAKYPDIKSVSRLVPLKGVKFVGVFGGSAAAHCLAIDEEGQCWTWGRNENGQLGQGNLANHNVPSVVKGLPSGVKAVAGACGKSHTVVVLENGEAYAWGNNKHGQLGIGTLPKAAGKGKEPKDENLLTPQRCLVGDAAAVACGAEFTVVLTNEGSVLSFGLPQYGQLGHGTDHEYNMKDGSVKLAYMPQPNPRAIVALKDRKVTKVACGHNHTVCVDEQGKIWTWGFGGYGRLGHKVQKDEFTPKMVEIQGGDRNLIPADAVLGAGSTSTWCSAAQGQLYAWGKLKVTGDNTMYPQPVLDLQGWTLRHLACGNTTFAAVGETSTITWGNGAYGELGYGPKGQKSSANPKLVDDLEGKLVHQVACGTGHTLFLIDAKDVEGLPEWDPPSDDVPEPEAKAEGGKRKADAAPKGKGGKAAKVEPKKKAQPKKKK